MRTKTIFLVALSVAFLFGCNKIEKVNTSSNEKLLQNFAKWENAGNDANPYESDSAGYYHNDGIDYALSQSDSYSNQGFRDSLIEIIDGYSIFSFSRKERIAMDSLHNYTLIQDSIHQSFFDPFKSNFNNPAKIAMDSLSSILNGTYDSYDQLKDELISWESQVDTNSQIQGDEEAALLMGGNVARYSSLFWRDFDPNDYKTNVLDGGVALADAMGFINGFMFGIGQGLDFEGSFRTAVSWALDCSIEAAEDEDIIAG